MTKNHLKSIATPRTWDILRKDRVFVTKANPGPHNESLSVPIVVFMRDMLSFIDTRKEARYILHNKEVLVNGRKIIDHKFPVGRFDVISFPDINEEYQILLNNKGKLVAKQVKNGVRPYKVAGKTILKGGVVQLNFMDGSNLTIEKDVYKTGDTVVIEGNKITQHFALEKGAIVYLVGGKHIGRTGKIEDVMTDKILYKGKSDEKVETLKRYAVVIGKDKPLIPISE
jgi:small subunit ribosomal protein S4e